MRVISLSLSAFGPYRKKQIIHFDQINAESIFLISGPTGAGKTTIFDAICYSIYGKASGTDRDQDTLRSHFAEREEQTVVELVFALHQHEYKVVRSPKQWKAKLKGEGFTEEPASATLYRKHNDQWELLEAKIKDVNETLQSLIGLDYEQFRKMIMIPQGEFRRLISENSKEREEILQKIFRTYFYANMTEKIKEDANDLKQTIQQIEWKLEQEKAQIIGDSIELSSDVPVMEQLHHAYLEFVSKLDSLRNEKEVQRKKLNTLQEERYVKKQLVEKFNELELATQNKDILLNKEPEMNQKKESLSLAKKAEIIKPYETQWKRRNLETADQKKESERLKIKLSSMEEKFRSIKAQYDLLVKEEEIREKMRHDIHEQEQLLEKVMIMEELIRKRDSRETKTKQIKQTLQQLNGELQTLQHTKDLQYQFNEQLNKLKNKKQQAEFNHTNFNREINVCNDILNEEEERSKLRKEYMQTKKLLDDHKELVNRANKAYEKIENSYFDNLASELRSTLTAGQPCPVCGSIEHSLNNVETHELAAEWNLKEEKLKVTKMENENTQMERKLYAIREKGEAKKELLTRLYDALTEKETQWNVDSISSLKKELIEKVKKEKAVLNDTNYKIEELNKKLQDIHIIENKMGANKEKMSLLEKDYERYIEEFQQSKAKIATIEEQMPKEFTNLGQFRAELNKLTESYKKKIDEWNTIKESTEKLKEERNKIDTQWQQSIHFEKQLVERENMEYEALLQMLKKYGFDSMKSYQQSLLPEARIQLLENTIKEFDEKKHVVLETIETLHHYLEDKTKPNLSSLDNEIEVTNEVFTSLTQKEQVFVIKMEQIEKYKQSISHLEKELKEKEEEYYHIGEIAKLVKGDNSQRLSFERFVLSTFLDEILLQANIRLDKMTDHRFQLIRSTEIARRGAQSGLDLEVLDHYTGRRRSVKTLSGGEGFKAALSLALGMADIIQSHAGGVQLDTLFIDEGFGTLDEVSLEQAIQCLKDLQQGHRIIGVISHVPQLKEEIKTQLIVTSTNEGSFASFHTL
ncbi:AAA family ATPase [Gracilibacillus marinus]|uniref:Nuclease SbcCD subunit C n=1 Tax=Gracilibacillus marinus TaxID=630535 RepID=A0ABV8VT33_9BACI